VLSTQPDERPAVHALTGLLIAEIDDPALAAGAAVQG
jgi:hypothetical protein